MPLKANHTRVFPNRRFCTADDGQRFAAMAIAAHGAAHAVATCRYGFRFHAVHIGFGGRITNRHGRSIEALGLCEGLFVHVIRSQTSRLPVHEPQSEEALPLPREIGFRNLVVLLAGAVAEARHKKHSLMSAYWSVGCDVRTIMKSLALDDADKRVLWRAAEAEAKRFAREYRRV